MKKKAAKKLISEKRFEKTGDLKTIEVFYKKAWNYILDDDIKSAAFLLYKEMPQDLYDLALDIQFNRNEDTFFDKKLQNLITKVDDRLCQESTEDNNYNENIDDFKEQF